MVSIPYITMCVCVCVWGGHLSPLPSFPLQQVLLGSFPGLDHISFLEALEPVSENVTFWLWNRGQKDFSRAREKEARS